MVARRFCFLITLTLISVILNACIPTGSSAEPSATYTKTITIDATIQKIEEENASGDEITFDSTGLGIDLGAVFSFDDQEERNPGVFTMGFMYPNDSLLQLYYLPGAKEEWSKVSVRIDSLRALADSLFERNEDSLGSLVVNHFWDTRRAYDTTFTRSKSVLASACKFSVVSMTTIDEENSNAVVPLVISVETEGSLRLRIDQQASKPSGNPSFEFFDKPLNGSIRVTCPDPLK